MCARLSTPPGQLLPPDLGRVCGAQQEQLQPLWVWRLQLALLVTLRRLRGGLSHFLPFQALAPPCLPYRLPLGGA